MRLLCGPPGASGIPAALGGVVTAAGAGHAFRLIVPAPGLAERARIELARRGCVADPAAVMTLAELVDAAAPLPEASAADIEIAVADAIEEHGIPELCPVRDAPGLAQTAAGAVAELAAHGREPDDSPLSALYREAAARLRDRGLLLRGERQRLAALSLPSHREPTWVAGFFSFSDPEMSVIEALACLTPLTVVLPKTGTDPIVRRLMGLGASAQTIASLGEAASVRAFRARTPEEEAREIARRIAQELDRGRPARDIGVAIRGAGPWAGAVTAALARFGIPFRNSVPSPLEGEAVARWLVAWVTAWETGWELGATTAALRLAIPPPLADTLDLTARERLPASGLDTLRELGGELVAPWLDACALSGEAADGSAWAQRLLEIALRLPPPAAEPGDFAAVERVRRDRAARRMLERALARAAAARSGAVPLAVFWRAARTAIRHALVHPVDLRRDAVKMMTVYEACQFPVPCLFLCGLVEGEFPRLPAADPFLPEAVRRSLGLPGAAESDATERLLFEAAASAATEVLTLSWSQVGTRGGSFLPSSLLPAGLTVEETIACTRSPAARPPAESGSVPLSLLAQRHQRFSPSGLECFLDCPFQFFGRYTLRLATRPLPPGDRLDFRLQGEIVHTVLGAWRSLGGEIGVHFDRLYDALCDRGGVPAGFRRIAVRLQIRADLERFAASEELPLGNRVLVEWPFETTLDTGVPLRGRIDRIEVLPDDRLVIVDYKYSAAQGMRERVSRESALQGALYTVAAERALGRPAAAMIFASLKRDVAFHGWGDPGVTGRLAPIPLAWREESQAKAAGAAFRILDGAIAPAPRSPDLCPRCEFRDVCRYEASARAAGAAG
ncbi:MAG: PD-(D/E)XK nuclease family protein [Bryobacterales bacterium]|nr:PD-(D/E)XK nuclease family protein [Bryobacterales bacterium]